MGKSKTYVYQIGRVYKIKGKTTEFGARVIKEWGVTGNSRVLFEDIYTGKRFEKKQQYRYEK